MSISNAIENIVIWKKNQLTAENWHFKKLMKKELGVLKGDFWGIGCPNDTLTPCWLKLC